MFDQMQRGSHDAEPQTSETDGRTARVRLDQLAAQVTGDPCQEPTSTAAPPPGRVGRLVERWVPPGLAAAAPQRRRWIIVSAFLGTAAIAAIAALLVGGRPDPERPPPLPVAHASPVTSAARPVAASSAKAAKAEPLVVSVVGKVAKPGLITVPAGARVADAIEMAGGAHSDADLITVNLARRLVDGEQLYVGVPVPPAMQAAGGGAAADVGVPPGTGAGETKVDLNAADEEQLDSLPGVGEVTVQRILEWRAEHGRFTAVEQLREVEGIGEKRFERIREQVTVG
ncbi:ComEA family DNA-binding protein [Saccharomonospora sp. NPDC046836]|uniref:ComEA family DNA-binding protein n=1 Tax=Saccharomonospora sp. NPDC046836 TaxID=3156921 RepID=UPI0033FAE948